MDTETTAQYKQYDTGPRSGNLPVINANLLSNCYFKRQ